MNSYSNIVGAGALQPPKLLTTALHSAYRRMLKKQPHYSLVTVVTVQSLL